MRQRPYIAQAQGELLCGAIYVDEKQALLINCAETYSKLPSIDVHYEHYSGSPQKHSLPFLGTRCNKIRVCELEDRLIIGTSSSIILITSTLFHSKCIKRIISATSVNSFRYCKTLVLCRIPFFYYFSIHLKFIHKRGRHPSKFNTW